jgi:predicted RNA-binding protein associated with RNAse of E/G family
VATTQSSGIGILRLITIEYHRLPDKVGYLPSLLLYEDDDRMVVLNVLNRPTSLVVNGYSFIDWGCTAVWLIPNGEWYDLGAVYDSDYKLRGYYCDITTPATRTSIGYRTTDLMLDLCVLPDGSVSCLDEDEFLAAVQTGVLSLELAEKARTALDGLMEKAMKGHLLSPSVVELLRLPENVDEARNTVLTARYRQGTQQPLQKRE